MQIYYLHEDGGYAEWPDPLSLITIVHEADDGETQMLTNLTAYLHPLKNGE